jgi:hypothetical protein
MHDVIDTVDAFVAPPECPLGCMNSRQALLILRSSRHWVQLANSTTVVVSFVTHEFSPPMNTPVARLALASGTGPLKFMALSGVSHWYETSHVNDTRECEGEGPEPGNTPVFPPPPLKKYKARTPRCTSSACRRLNSGLEPQGAKAEAGADMAERTGNTPKKTPRSEIRGVEAGALFCCHCQ